MFIVLIMVGCVLLKHQKDRTLLITSLATYAKVSEYGFIETPYRVIDEKQKLTDEVKYFTAFEESGKTIAQLDASHIDGDKLIGNQVPARKAGDFALVDSNEVELMDVAPTQMISIATSLIPFLSMMTQTGH